MAFAFVNVTRMAVCGIDSPLTSMPVSAVCVLQAVIPHGHWVVFSPELRQMVLRGHSCVGLPVLIVPVGHVARSRIAGSWCL